MIEKELLYYTDNRLDGMRTKGWQNRDIDSWVKKLLVKAGLPIVSVSLKPIDFGRNIVLDLEPNPLTMTKQILEGIRASEAEFIYFCEHDILYHQSHFDFVPPKNDVYYYNVNGWKWDYNTSRVITHDHMVGLYGLIVGRDKILDYFEKKLSIIYERGYDKEISKYPHWIRKMAYEPGKPIRHGGIADDTKIEFRSEQPLINIRHRRTATPQKMDIEGFIRKPTGWKESTIDKLLTEDYLI